MQDNHNFDPALDSLFGEDLRARDKARKMDEQERLESFYSENVESRPGVWCDTKTIKETFLRLSGIKTPHAWGRSSSSWKRTGTGSSGPRATWTGCGSADSRGSAR